VLPPCVDGVRLLLLPPETTPLLVSLLALPVDPRPLPPLPLPDDVDPDGPPLLLLEGVDEGDPVLLGEVELCEAYTIVVSVEPVIRSAAKTRHKAKLTENLLFRIIF